MPTDEDRIATGRLLLGAEVRARRKKAGLQLAELAALAEISQTYLSDIERGNKMPPLPTLDTLATGLNTTVAELLNDIYPWGIRTAPDQLPATLPDGRAGRSIRRSSGEA